MFETAWWSAANGSEHSITRPTSRFAVHSIVLQPNQYYAACWGTPIVQTEAQMGHACCVTHIAVCCMLGYPHRADNGTNAGHRTAMWQWVL